MSNAAVVLLSRVTAVLCRTVRVFCLSLYVFFFKIDNPYNTASYCSVGTEARRFPKVA